MNQPPKILMALALSLIMSALPVSAQVAASAVTKITSLPFTVPVSGGTFVLTSDLSCPTPESTAIGIPTTITAPVLLDLKGFTTTGGGVLSTGIGIGFNGVSNAFPISVRKSTYGVQDILSPGGNRFNNISMNSVGDPLLISTSQAAPVLVLETCEFAPPPV